MPHLNILARMLVGWLVWPRWPQVLVLLASLACALGVVGCASTPHPIVTEKVAQGLLRKVCWLPEELDPKTKHFVFLGNNGAAVSDQDKAAFASAVVQAGLVYEYDKSAPVENLRLIPLTRPDAWCTDVPKPTDEAVLRLFDPCADGTAQANGPAAKNLLAQFDVKSTYYCNQNAQMQPTTQQLIMRRNRQSVYLAAVMQAQAIATVLTQAEADMLRVINNDDSWLKRLFLSDPGTLEQIQERVAKQLDSIESPPEYNDKYLDLAALSGFHAGFDKGKFDVEAKLFAIDAGILVLEVVATEIVTAGVGGVAVAAARTGARAVKFTSTAGRKALVAAMKRLENVPIFIPVANGGVGTYVTAGQVLKSMSRYHARRLETAMFAKAREVEAALKAAGKPFVPLVKRTTDETHHIVAHGADKAKGARKRLAELGIDIDNPANGVFLPANMSSPNPLGSIVHRTLGNNKRYYEKVQEILEAATSQADALQRLERIGETLKNGTFFHARF